MLLQLANINKKDIIVDWGCGLGSLLRVIMDRYQCLSYGINISYKQLQLAKQKFRINETIRLLQTTGTQILLKDVAEIKDRFSETPNGSYLEGNTLINISVTSTNSEDVISSAATVRKYINRFNETNDNTQLEVLDDASVTLTERNQLLTENGLKRIYLFLKMIT